MRVVISRAGAKSRGSAVHVCEVEYLQGKPWYVKVQCPATLMQHPSWRTIWHRAYGRPLGPVAKEAVKVADIILRAR